MNPRRKALLALAFIGTFFPILAYFHLGPGNLRYAIFTSALISYAGFMATRWLIPHVALSNLKAGLSGLDLNKKGSPEGTKKIPEALGLAVGVVYLICIIFIQQLHYYDATCGGYLMGQCSDMASNSADWLLDYNAALATICFMLFLGFADDVLDIRWRVKLLLPALATLPLLVAYSGGTGIYVPKPLHGVLGLPAFLELGIIYKIYMVLLTVFCTNSINILAGVNGLEAGQTFVIACAILFHNLLILASPLSENPSIRNGHLFSIFLICPLATTTFALVAFNWYPASVFVGDTFTYFAGMTIAVAGILGHFSETLLIFLIPQILNFLYSLPQLAKIVPCPRHRLPKYNPQTKMLYPTPQWNLVNLMLQVFGPCSEEQLCIRILTLQGICCALGFVIRWLLEGWYK